MSERPHICENNLKSFEKGDTWEWFQCTVCGRHICITGPTTKFSGLKKEEKPHG